MAEAALKKTTSKAAPKRKPAAKSKAPAKSKPVAKAESKLKEGISQIEKSASEFTAKAKETGRSTLLAGLGLYGTAYDVVQERLDGVQSKLESRKQDADKTYKKLVKRGEQLEKETIKAIDDFQIGGFELNDLTDRSKLEANLKKAKARLEEFKESATARFAV